MSIANKFSFWYTNVFCVLFYCFVFTIRTEPVLCLQVIASLKSDKESLESTLYEAQQLNAQLDTRKEQLEGENQELILKKENLQGEHRILGSSCGARVVLM